MVKWKKMNKKMAGLLLGVMMLFTASTTAFAYVDESAEASKVETTQTEQSTDKEEKKDEATTQTRCCRKMEQTRELHLRHLAMVKSRMTLPMIPQRNFLRLQRRITTLSIS